MEQLHLLLEIITPLVLAAIFVINLIQSRSQAKDKLEMQTYHERVKDDLHTFNGQVRDSIGSLKNEIADLRTEVRVHAGKDEEYQKGLSRTLHRMDEKLEK